MNKFAFEFGRALVKSNAAAPETVVGAVKQLLSVLGSKGVTAAKHVGGVTGLLPSQNEADMLRDSFKYMLDGADSAQLLTYFKRPSDGLDILHSRMNDYRALQNKITNSRLRRGAFTGTGLWVGDKLIGSLSGQ